VWSLKTGRLLDVLAGHEGPVSCLAFNPVSNALASGSWDKTVRYATWSAWGLVSVVSFGQQACWLRARLSLRGRPALEVPTAPRVLVN
jgi:WD40 repeat protein